MKKLILIILPVLFCIYALSYLYLFFADDSGAIEDIGQTAFALFDIVAILRIAYEGTFRISPLIKLGYVGLAMFLLGALMKIQHWEEASLFIFCGCVILAVAYGVHFSRKMGKAVLDWLKFVYVLTALVVMVVRLLHLSTGEIWQWLIMGITLILVATWYFQQLQKKEESFEELAEDNENIFRQEP